jgi:hypothetical protein
MVPGEVPGALVVRLLPERLAVELHAPLELPRHDRPRDEPRFQVAAAVTRRFDGAVGAGERVERAVVVDDDVRVARPGIRDNLERRCRAHRVEADVAVRARRRVRVRDVLWRALHPQGRAHVSFLVAKRERESGPTESYPRVPIFGLPALRIHRRRTNRKSKTAPTMFAARKQRARGLSRLTQVTSDEILQNSKGYS